MRSMLMLEMQFSTLKARLVNQDTLASISRLYGLLSSVRTATAAYEAVAQSSKNAAEIFEACIGGLFHDHLERANVTNANAAVLTQGPAFDKITEWLEPIFRPMAERGYDPADADEEEEDRLAVGAISELFETLQRWGARPSFSEMLETPPGANPLHGGMWRITCTVQIKGKSWSASAVRAKKQDAKAVAAWKVLQHSRGDLQPRGFCAADGAKFRLAEWCVRNDLQSPVCTPITYELDGFLRFIVKVDVFDRNGKLLTSQVVDRHHMTMAEEVACHRALIVLQD
ncbi:hypothetical protein TREMEDRAFT_64769 [Tremella mesenterica DSM 1558]|uniref:uncharacterized protein n=1 Tax=Tremella mesenterica (strain ATCC 24925 / CBS 8224 / DSM 1558 / NBRC 9311 / NRRL Y-6157 / RJB 2259-6 / UBC 559-6) TaxID=578456 RepID=UPI0003F48E34|nr:uncharacterized protein TREMEDRAFT_64769 [Tremella mesenterica DSM 1558]EIW66915.1 hypothetical protein TREMEDRAFT_64769 [Tremella mesenterica DSM 1558]